MNHNIKHRFLSVREDGVVYEGIRTGKKYCYQLDLVDKKQNTNLDRELVLTESYMGVDWLPMMDEKEGENYITHDAGDTIWFGVKKYYHDGEKFRSIIKMIDDGERIFCVNLITWEYYDRKNGSWERIKNKQDV